MTTEINHVPFAGDHELRRLEDDDAKAGEVEHHDGEAASNRVVHVSAFADWSAMAITRTFWRTWLFAVCAAYGALFDGYAVAIPGSIIANPGFIAVFGTVESATGLALDAQHVAAWGGIQSAGQILGMFSGPFLSDRFGRKASMQAISAFLIIACILEIVSKEWKVYLVARLFAGLGTGFVQSGLTVYISEIAPAQVRGAMLSMYSFFFAIGQFTAAIALKIVVDMGPDKFRHSFYSQFVLIGTFLPLTFLIPESPWYLARRHKHEQAKKSMLRLSGNVPGYDIEREYAVLSQNVANDEAQQAIAKRSTYVELFRGINGRRTFISFFPLAFQQFVGISLTFGYATYFFSLSGVSDAFLSSLIVNLVLIVCILISFWTTEKAGRRPSLMSGGALMGLCTLFIGVIGSLPGGVTGGTGRGQALVALTAIWVAAYALSAGPLGWTFVAESSTPQLRAKTAGVAAAGTALLGLVFNYSVPIMLDTTGANWGLYIGYFWAGLTFLALVVVFFTIPETRGRTYAELDELFERRIPARRFASTKTRVDELRSNLPQGV